jgi:hypothetical protein
MHFTTISRPVAARARRIALIVASVPLFTNRTISTDGTAPVTTAASCASYSVGIPKLVPRPIAFDNAATTRSFACPTISGP